MKMHEEGECKQPNICKRKSVRDLATLEGQARELYELYPRRQVWGRAKKLIPKIIEAIAKERGITTGDAFRFLRDIILEYREGWQRRPKKEWKFIPLITSWLNAAQWEDDRRWWHLSDKNAPERNPNWPKGYRPYPGGETPEEYRERHPDE